MTDWRDIEDVWQSWLRETTGLVCIWANQDAPAPRLPYVTLEIMNITPLGAYDEVRWQVPDGDEASLIEREVGYRRATLSVQVDAVPIRHVDQARTILSAVQDALHRASTRASFRNRNIAIGEVGRITTYGVRIRDTMMSRANLDVQFVVETRHDELVPALSPDEIPIRGEVSHEQ